MKYNRNLYIDRHNLPSPNVVRDLIYLRGYEEVSISYRVSIYTIKNWINK